VLVRHSIEHHPSIHYTWSKGDAYERVTLPCSIYQREPDRETLRFSRAMGSDLDLDHGVFLL
jgi:hypothetical protein